MSNLPEHEKIVWSSCNVNCGNRCALRLHVKNGVVVRVSPDNTGESDPFGTHEIRACLKGRGLRKWVYSHERLLSPLKRVGERGDGRFERISWDEALDTIAERLRQVIDSYGNEAVYRNYGTGSTGVVVSGREQVDRLMNLLGGRLNYHNTYSTAQISQAMEYTYGKEKNGNYLTDIVHSRLVVFFGNNPAETRMSGGGPVRDLIASLQKQRVKVIVIDPRFTDTASTVADEWIPIRPGTDAALVSALAYVLITENLVDQPFLDRYCVGYDPKTMPADIPEAYCYKDYILGQGPDGIAKTPDWAVSITGIPADRIISLAREIGLAKPAYISQGWGAQRQANGEQTARAICMLAIITGNVGIPGGNTGDREGPFNAGLPKLPIGRNPVAASIPCFMWTKAIADHRNFSSSTAGLRGKDQLEVPIKFVWNVAGNILINQHSEIAATEKILKDSNLCEMIVVIDTVMTASARYADIILPGTTTFEESDLAYQGTAVEMGALILRQQAIEPLGEAQTIYDICTGVAQRLGIEDEFTEGRTHDQWVEFMYHQCRKVRPELPADYAEALDQGIFKWPRSSESLVGLRSFREDPDKNPLSTPSGKIEIFSRRLWELACNWSLPEGDVISAVPEYHQTWGMPGDPECADYPLQLIGHHYKPRAHSSYANNPWLREVAPHSLWINPLDAEKRTICHGDRVRVFNQQGMVEVVAKVTPRIMPGVLSLPQGAWYAPDEQGIDQGGCINTLTRQRPSPLAKGNPQHTNLVQVEKVV